MAADKTFKTPFSDAIYKDCDGKSDWGGMGNPLPGGMPVTKGSLPSETQFAGVKGGGEGKVDFADIRPSGKK